MRSIGKLSALAVSKAKQKGLYADGGNLYLQITATGAKSWLFRFMQNGRAREMGLGPLHAVSLAEARIHAGECRTLLLQKIDPIEARNAKQQQAKLENSSHMTFAECAEAYINAHKAGWKNAKHIGQWNSTLATYAYPVIGNLSVQLIDIALVMKVLEPIWQQKTETASRLRGRIESILDWATVSGYRQGDNPAQWKGRLENLLPKRSRVQKTEHHAALPYAEIGAFMVALSLREGLAARALELTILTAARTGEIIGATWQEFDLPKKLWVVPAERMKMQREHRVPLSDKAVSMLQALYDAGNKNAKDYLFPGGAKGKPLSNMAMLVLLKRMKREDITVHGFRSTFRDWAAEQTDYPREVAEAALAHAAEDKVEAAYQRGDFFEKRKGLMAEWSSYCYKVKG